MLRILGRKTSGNVQKVLWCCDELGVAYQREDYGRQFQNTATAEYLALNPNGKVPTVVDGGVAIWESNTILRYLANKHGGSLYPADPAARSHVERWMDWQLSTINTPFIVIFMAMRNAPENRDQQALDAAVAEVSPLFAMLDAQIADQGMIGGPSLSLADIALGPTIHRWHNFAIDRPTLPNLRRWYDTMLQRKAFVTHIVNA
jgi:glutathione S-transferase